MRLKGRTALISGASRNSGKAIALTFAREGADLILVARSGDELRQVARECEALGVQVLAVPADVGDYHAVNKVVELGLARFGKVDSLVSVAALRPHRNFWEYADDEWRRVFEVNLHSTFYFAKALVPGMMERKSGTIVACGGLASLTSNPIAALTAATKHGLYGLIKALARELGPYGVRANLIAVGSIKVDRRNPEWYPPGQNPHLTEAEHANTPLRRGGSTEELANVALFLSSEESSYVTGDRIICAGGRFM
jgi:NAD(P)-dependent dehydrogenase (short-subunit alcohol dehydrogenase family)